MKAPTSKVLSAVMAAVLALGLCPTVAFADDSSDAAPASEAIAVENASEDATTLALEPVGEADESTGTSAVALASEVTGTFTDSDANKQAFYRFTVSEAGSVHVNVTAAFRGTYTLYDWIGSELWNHSGSNDWNNTSSQAVTAQSVNVTAGTYYLLIKGGTGTYSLSLSFTSAQESFAESQGGSDNSLATANSIELGKDYKGQIAANDAADFYSFELANAERICLDAVYGTRNATYKLYDASGAKVWEFGTYYNDWNSTTGQCVTREMIDLTKGSYRLSVEGDAANYVLRLSHASAQVSFEEAQGGSNNSIQDAQSISTGSSYKGQLAKNDSVDFYRFSVSRSGDVSVRATTDFRDAIYKIYDTTGAEVWTFGTYYNGWNSTTGQTSNAQTITLSAGTYYFSVSGGSNVTGNYAFSLGGSSTPACVNPSFDVASLPTLPVFESATNVPIGTTQTPDPDNPDTDPDNPSPDPDPEPTPDPDTDPDNPATQASVERLAGVETAYQTSAKISEEAFPNGSEWIVLARDDDFADAMSATGLAGALKAPIVLTDRFGLSTEAANEIKRLGAKSCYIIGGTAAMPGAFETQLKALGLTAVERVFGSESWDTSVACANKISLHGGNKAGDAIVAMSLKFRDALSISSFAYKYGVPIYLQTAEGDRPLPAAAISAISNLRGTIYVAGGNGAVRESTVEDVFGIDRVVRMAGTTGYDTSNQIATYMVNNGLLSADTVCVACGATAAHGSDALSGAALAGTRGGVMLMTNGNAAMENVRTTTIDGCDSEGTPAFLSAHASEVSTAYLLGGTFVIPESLADRVEAILGV